MQCCPQLPTYEAWTCTYLEEGHFRHTYTPDFIRHKPLHIQVSKHYFFPTQEAHRIQMKMIGRYSQNFIPVTDQYQMLFLVVFLISSSFSMQILSYILHFRNLYPLKLYAFSFNCLFLCKLDMSTYSTGTILLLISTHGYTLYIYPLS